MDKARLLGRTLVLGASILPALLPTSLLLGQEPQDAVVIPNIVKQSGAAVQQSKTVGKAKSRADASGYLGPNGLYFVGKATAQIVGIPHHYYVQYRAYIPADHLVTSVPCWRGQEIASIVPDSPLQLWGGLIEVLGDASPFSTQYRIKEYVNLSTNSSGPASEPAVAKVPSVSYNFESFSTQGNITEDDFTPPPLRHLCHLEQSTGSSNLTYVGGTASSTSANQASVTFSGSGTDPLFKKPVAPIQFNITVSINAKTNEATITGTHTCFPSHEIVVGNQVVYSKDPAAVTFYELSKCLIGPLFQVPQTTVNCPQPVPLDGVSRCTE